MNIAVFGTGAVGQTFAKRLTELGHHVSIGTRNVESTLSKTEPDTQGTPAMRDFLAQNSSVELKSFQDAALGSEIVILATRGDGAKAVLEAAGNTIDGKTILDISNPLDFSKGMPPSLYTCNTSSLAEELQSAFPNVHIVKTLNTMWCGIMVNPRLLKQNSTVFVSGNNEEAKSTAVTLLKQFGWQDAEILDLGDISTARGTEMLLPIWLRVWMATGNGAFNFSIAR